MERTKLHRFMEGAEISNPRLADESGVSLRQIINIKQGEQEPTRGTMAAILIACRRITGRRNIAITDLFDFTQTSRIVTARAAAGGYGRGGRS